jgi:hypothetical protein|tara:strand:- start:1746 stop:1916 length:171 start_codon:yes stop_codon:yes gene_type:complete
MNPSEFERNKPRETRKAIKELREYLMMLHENGETVVYLPHVLNSLNDIESKFLKGD